jgi:hypothetical protein
MFWCRDVNTSYLIINYVAFFCYLKLSTLGFFVYLKLFLVIVSYSTLGYFRLF